MTKDDEYRQLGDYAEEDVEEPDFEGKTEAGGWWAVDSAPDRRAHTRVPFDAKIELIPPDGNVHECEAVNLSMGGVLLRKTNEGPLPNLGQMMVIEVQGDDVMLDAVVVRAEPDSRRFAAQFVNLEASQRDYLAGQVGQGQEGDVATGYGVTRPKP